MPNALDIAALLGRLISAAQERFGDTATISAASGVPVDLLIGAQRGDLDGWTTSTAESIATSMGIDPAAVWDPSAPIGGLGLSFLRGDWPDFHPDDVDIFSKLLERAAALRNLRSLLGLPTSKRAAFSQSAPRPPFHRDGYQLAGMVRTKLGLGDGPLPNLHLLVPSQLDIEVAHCDLRTARLQAAALVRSDAEAIALNDRVESRRLFQRRSIAHELCHILFDEFHSTVGAVLEGDEDSEPHEVRARAFAAELLAPESGLISLLGMPERVHSIRRALKFVEQASVHFAAPAELATNHLVNTGFIDKCLRSDIIDRSKSFRIRHPEQRVDVLSRRIDAAVRDFVITSGRAAELRAVS